MEVDQLEGSSDLFGSVLGGLTDEQWEEYKRQQKLAGDYICDDSEDECDFADSRSCSPNILDEEVVTQIEVVQQAESESASEGEVEAVEPESSVTFNSDAAVQYVNGEISFSELAEIMERSKKSRKRKLDWENRDEEDDMENDEWQDESKVEKTKKKKRTRRRMYQLPKEFQGLMGTANLSFARGDTDSAIKTCLELIRQAPYCEEPYQTLGVIYEEIGDMKKSLQCCLLAAYLNPSDTEEWIRLAGLSIEQSQIQQAIRCYSFAIRNEPTNINLLWERCNLYELVGDRKNSLTGYELILRNLSSPEDGQKCVEIAREISKVHHENEDFANSMKVLETAFSKFPHLITSEDVNLLLELQVNQKCYKPALKNFILHCGGSLQVEGKDISWEEVESIDDEQIKKINRCTVPEVLPIDIQVKLLLCLIHLRAIEAAKDALQILKQESPDDVGDLYLDVAEAFLLVNEPSFAEPLLMDLVSSKNYNLAAVWLKYGDCLNMLLRGEEATEAYKTVLKMAPSYQEARLSLSKILLETGRKQEAASVLKQEYEDGKEDAVVDLQILIERCKLLYELGHFNEFITAGILAQYSHCFKLETHEEQMLMVHNKTHKRRIEVLKDTQSVVNRTKPSFVNTDIAPQEMWDIFQKLSKKLFEVHRYQELHDISFEALSSSLWKKSPEMAKDAEFQALLACMFNGNHTFAFFFIKDLIFKNVHNNRAWNLLCLNVTCSEQIRHNRFCLRLMLKNPDHFALGLFNGHNAMNSGSYKHALGEYVSLLKSWPDNPELMFYTGITYVHMASQKFGTKKHLLVAQAIAFLQKYMKLRSESQESLYNVGRALHQLGIKDAAVVYYKRALETPPVLTSCGEEDVFDLRHEIAFNLALIYQSVGSNDLASMYLRRYNVV